MEYLWPLLISIITALIIAGGALFAAKKGGEMAAKASRDSVRETLERQEKREKEHQRGTIQGVLQAFYEELNILWEQLDYDVASRWEEYNQGKKEYFTYQLFISTDYLTMYRANANLIGQIKVSEELQYKLGLQQESELRRSIVKVYMIFQVLIDGYRYNNSLIDEYNKAQYDENERAIRVSMGNLQKYAPQLRETHNKFKIEIEYLLKILEKISNI